MISKLNLAILTDHSVHSQANSIYSIVPALLEEKEVTHISLISRGDPRNRFFFNYNSQQDIYAIEANEEFKFQHASQIFLNSAKKIRLQDYDILLLRLARPTENRFFKFLIDIFPEGRIINNPTGIIETSNKKFLLQIAEHCPPIRLCNNWNEIVDFLQNFPIVLKPLESHGGTGLIKLENNLAWLDNKLVSSLQEFKIKYDNNPINYLGMKYLKRVHEGDKRIVVANNQIISCYLRLPPDNSWLCNIAQGGSSRISSPDKNELRIINSLAPILTKKGIFVFGLDTLMNDDGQRVVSELNTLSVGGILKSEGHPGIDPPRVFAKQLIKYISKNIH